MKSYKWHAFIILLLLMILQPFLEEWLGVKGISINFVLYFTMLFAFMKKPVHSFTLAAVLGLGYDMIYSNWLGKMMIILLLGTALVLIVDKRVYRENIPALVGFFLVSVFVLENIYSLMEVGFGEYFDSFLFIQSRIIWMAVYAAALSVVMGLVYLIASLKGDRSIRMKGI